jgi:pimeloyl-ACP methyl ester carboxylesterase
MPRVPVNGTELFYQDSGHAAGGETIVFSHGLLWDTSLFDAQVDALRGRYRCIAYDHRGQGQSAESPLRSIGMDLVAEDAAALIEALDLGPVHFCGLSMGGFAGLRLASRRPELLRSLIVMDTTARAERTENIRKYRMLNRLSRWFGHGVLAGRVMRILYGRSTLRDPGRAADLRRWRAKLVGNRRSIWRAVNGVIDRPSVEDELTQVAVPTLVMVGEEDVAQPPAEAERLCAAIAGARLVRIQGAGHSATVEQPDRVTEAIAGFLGGLTALGEDRRASRAAS